MEEADDSNAVPLKVVGIGASAGGLHALESLFDELAVESGMAFVVIQHLSPDFDSMMDQLLSRHTQISVTLIQDGMLIEPDRIYLLPPGKQVIMSNDRLLLTERAEGTSLAFPIDEFFRSLAQNVGESAIGIILSGTGTDGARGIRDIAGAGGLVIAQSLETADFDGMPRSACDTGVVDLVLSPKEIARTLHRLAGKKTSTQESVKEATNKKRLLLAKLANYDVLFDEMLQTIPTSEKGRFTRLIRSARKPQEESDSNQIIQGRIAEVHPSLTPSELRTCSMIVHGWSSKEIAARSGTSLKNIEKHRSAIRKKAAIPRSVSLQVYLSGLV